MYQRTQFVARVKEIVIAGLVVACAACGKANEPAPAQPGTTAAVTPPASVTLAELKFYLGDEAIMALNADGTIRAATRQPHDKSPPSWQVVAKLASDGSIMRDGTLMGRLNPDGLFETPDHKEVHLIDGNAIDMGDGHKISIGDDGVLVGGEAGFPALRVQGLTDAGSRRAALLMVMLAFMPSSVTTLGDEQLGQDRPGTRTPLTRQVRARAHRAAWKACSRAATR